MARTHYRLGRGQSARKACGMATGYGELTGVPEKVTCKRCMRTEHYLAAVVDLPETVTPDKGWTAAPTPQQVVDFIAKQAHEVAHDQGYCDTYEYISEEIGGLVAEKFGVTWPQPERTWTLRFEEYEVRATSEEEALKIVAADLTRYVSAYSG